MGASGRTINRGAAAAALALFVSISAGGAHAQMQNGLKDGFMKAMAKAGTALSATQKPVAGAQPARKHARSGAARDAGVATYVVPVDKGTAATAPAGPARPEECASYVFKVATDPSQSVCARK